MDLSHRKSEVTLALTDAAGRPLSNAPVTVEMARHRFLFGCNAFSINRATDPAMEEAYRRRYLDLLNFATLPFYWGRYESQPGTTEQEAVSAQAKWCCDNGVITKGHPLCWHEVVPKWAITMPPEQVEQLQWRRISRDVAAFAGLIDRWDVINETAVMPGYQVETNPITGICNRLGRIGLIKQVFTLARQANPAAMLVLNDFDTSEKFERIIEESLAAGVPFDVIGIQSHMHKGYWGAEKAADVCGRFARFGKPIHFTEATLVSGALKTDDDWHTVRPGWDSTPEGEARQAREVEEFYTTLFAHPAVEAVTWWDFSDAYAWQGAPSGLVRKDMSPKPAYEALLRLVKREWWTAPQKLKTGPAGRVKVAGFQGDYALRAGDKEGRFALDRTHPTVAVRME